MRNAGRLDRPARRPIRRSSVVLAALAAVLGTGGCGVGVARSVAPATAAADSAAASGAATRAGSPAATRTATSPGRSDRSTTAQTPAGAAGAAANRSPAATTARLPLATTFTTLTGAPTDPRPFQPPDGLVVHPTSPRTVHDSPGGTPFAVLPTTELGSPTWVPVIETRAGWARVLLPSRPNRSTGWLRTGVGLLSARTDTTVQVDLAAHRLAVRTDGRLVGSWQVAVGAPRTPTPPGRTFLLASLAPPELDYSPLLLPLGTHSATLDTFGGGPGTVALHGWPDPAVFGRSVSHGCVRVPPAALAALSRVPLGSAVLISP